MILYKALYDYESEEVNDLCFHTNDIIEYLSQSSSSWYKGKNILTGKTGLFPYNFVSKVDIPEDGGDIYIIVEEFEEYSRGDILLSSEVCDCDVIGYLLTDNDKILTKYPLKYLLSVNEKSNNTKFIKCIATTDSHGDLTQLHFSVGDTIWMIRKIDDSFGEGIFNGKKGIFSLDSVEIDDEERTQSIDRKNRWIALFDYKSDDSNDLRFLHGEKLKFLDRIDNNWMLMQNEDGTVGMVPCNFVKNISIKGSPQNKKTEEIVDTEDKESRISMPLKPIINELVNHQKKRTSYSDIKRESQIQDSMMEDPNFGSILCSHYDDTDENIYEEDNRFRRELNTDPLTGSTVQVLNASALTISTLGGIYENGLYEPQESLLQQFEEREKRVMNEMEVIMDDIASIRNNVSRQDSEDHYVHMMSSNLSFLKEEYKERQKQLAFIKGQRERIFTGSILDIEESDYCSLRYNVEMDKKSSTRSKVIEEILETENKFNNDLELTLKVFNHSEMINKISDQDYNSIFGDLNAIISVSRSFYSDLFQAVENCGVDVPIGSIFLKFLQRFELVYKEYCVNYDRKLELVNKKPRSQEIEDFMKEGLKKMHESGTFIACIDAMLVKPLQRFLKYPLFMKTIIQNTDEEHIDITDLRSALIEFERIAKKINEKKRFEELRTEIFERNGQWHQKTLHAIQKVPKRLLVASLYGLQRDDDPEYRLAVAKFKNLQKCVSFFIETIVILRDNLKEVLMLHSSINEDLSRIVKCSSGSQLQQFISICKNSESNYYKNYVSVMETLVLNPLTKLLELFSGPKILIKKRKSKYLDYLVMKQKMEDKEVTRVQAERMEELKNQYLAINNTLKEELPILTSKSAVFFNECLANYLQMTTSILQISVGSLRGLIGDEDEPVEEEQRNCRYNQTEVLNRLQRNMLTYHSRNDVYRVELSPTNPRRYRSDSVSRTEYYCQTEEDISNLKTKFEFKNLAYVKKDFIPTKLHQIYVSMGNIVGILKRCDPQGHTNSWLIEVCLKRVGFVPRSYLNSVPFNDERKSSVTSPTFSRSRHSSGENRNSPLDNTQCFDLMQFSPNACGLKSTLFFEQSLPKEVRVALFDFKSTGQTDISMRKGDQLQLIESHDKTGNTSWSLVRNLRSGAQGYVPTNYMAVRPVDHNAHI